MSTTTSSHILHHATAFTSHILSNFKLRRHIITTLLHTSISTNQVTEVTHKHLNLAVETLENAITFSTNTTIRSSSLSLAEKLLLPLPHYPLSSFLLSLIHSLSNRHTESSLSLLKLFHSIPNLARSEIAPSLYDHLFSLHLIPVFHWFHHQRTLILSSASSSDSCRPSDYSIEDESVVMPSEKLLSRMSEDQATKLREVEREYEEVLDENCRVLAVYFEEVLVTKNGDGIISTPTLLLPEGGGSGGSGGGGMEKRVETEMLAVENGRYNNVIK